MSSSAYSRRRMNEEAGCHSGTSRLSSVNSGSTNSKNENDSQNNAAKSRTVFCDTHSYSKAPSATQALNTFVDMALALQENTERRNDHTYALKNMRCQTRVEEIDPPYRKKDHTYASNTIGFRYTSHRGSHAQPRKSVSEENLVVKSNSSSETSARKCTSTEEFVIPDESESSSKVGLSTSRFSPTHRSNAATLPRPKAKSYNQPMFPEPGADNNDSAQNSATESVRLPQPCPGNTSCDSLMEAPVKCDHTYAKYSEMGKCAGLLKDDQMMSLLSSSAPGKLNRSGYADHTYDKLSSAKIKDIYEEHMFCKSFKSLGNRPESSQTGIFSKDVVNIAAENSSCSSAMDWQPQEHVQTFERRFLPIDHTYTTVA